MWSPTASLAPLAAKLGPKADIVHNIGDPMFSTRGVRLAQTARENYLSTAEVRITDPKAVRGEVARFVRMLDGEPLITSLIEKRELDVVVWVAVFGAQGAIVFDDLNIDMQPFGPRIGLVLENYADFDSGGNPRKLLIGPSARNS